jgi:hypothetical protein
VVKVLALLFVLLMGALVAADRVGVSVAEERVAAQIAQRAALTGPPAVEITGVPFLTQAVAGRYDEVRVRLTAEQLGQPAGTVAEVSLSGVRVPLSDVLSGSVQEVPVDRVQGTATLPYELITAQLSGDATLTPEGDGLRVTRDVEVLGLRLALTAAGTVRLEQGDLVVDVDDATAVGIDVPDVVLDRAADRLDIRYAVPALPFGLQLTGVDPGPDGVQVRFAGEDTVLAG